MSNQTKQTDNKFIGFVLNLEKYCCEMNIIFEKYK